MFKIWSKLTLLLFLLSPILIFEKERCLAAAEDEVEEEIVDEEEDDDEAVVDEGTTGTEVEDTGESEDEEADKGPQGSPDADTLVLFTSPTGEGTDLPAGKLVELLVGFSNNGDRDFVLDSIDASFRYPMDFNFYIQNFTAIPYHRIVKPRQEATVMYSFYPNEAFTGRPLGLTVNLAYHDADGEDFVEAVFNKTVNIIEIDEGLDGETFFLYLFLLAFAILLLLAGHHFLSSYGRKKGEPKKPVVEVGTSSKSGIDYDWLPKELIQEINKSPKAKQEKQPTRQSPRQKAHGKSGR